MMRIFAGITLAALMSGAAFGQSRQTRPTFEVADVHVSARIANNILDRLGPKMDFRTSLRGERYELHNATMVDLISTAYGIEADRVLGGPNWLEFDRFDVTALVPRNTPQATLKLMLQSLLADRFKLVVHNNTKPIPGFVLSMGKEKPKLKEADASGKTGCQLVRPPSPAPGQTFVPTKAVSCRNITMEGFAAELKAIESSGYLTKAVIDSTGLKGSWDFDFRFTENWALQIARSDRVSLFDAIDKQLGLKLVEQNVPATVIMVDRVNEKPTDNPANVAQKLPPLPPPEFEVAVIKPRNTDASFNAGGLGVQPGGRVNIPGAIIPLKQLISIAWNLDPNEELIGAPKWLDSARFDILAKLPADVMAANGGSLPVQSVGPMLQSLLIDRFKMKIHYEERPVTAYALVAAKPKLKEADSSTRTGCKLGSAPGTGPLGLPSRTVSCQNMTMAQFADQPQSIAGPNGGPYVHYPIVDATGLEGGWDFNFTFSPLAVNPVANPFGPSPADAGAAASEPAGGSSLIEAVEKQLGLKLEAQKRPYRVFVIDHIEEKPTDN